jgi:D-alanyl-D-alanine dipeptidase
MSRLEVRVGAIYNQYDLKSLPFDMQQFSSEWGKRLEQAGLGNIAEDISLDGVGREFLSEPLSDEAVKRVNASETLVSAKDAEDFQRSVALTDIQESHEKLVDLRKKDMAWTFTDARYHEACGPWAGKEKLFLVRESVATRLSRLATLLSRIDVGMHFEDGFRPLGVQEGLFARRIAMARDTHPEWSDEELVLEARSKTAYTPRFAAHKAGAAVDVRLFDIGTGNFHDIGHAYPDGGEIVRLNTEFVTQHQWSNRKILEHLAKASGLSMYPYEDWHLCYGDATAAVVDSNGQPPFAAKYGPVKTYDATTGEVLEVYDQEELDAVFALKG